MNHAYNLAHMSGKTMPDSVPSAAYAEFSSPLPAACLVEKISVYQSQNIGSS
eukprot:COSAG01_NODE_710_length_14110_cov_94.506745_11_plen_52_part_00